MRLTRFFLCIYGLMDAIIDFLINQTSTEQWLSATFLSTRHTTDGREVFFLEVKGYVDQTNQYRNLYQRAYHRSECLTRLKTKNRHRHGDGQLEVVCWQR